jgi:hypothetical protein
MRVEQKTLRTKSQEENIYTRNKSKKFQIISNFVKMSNHFVLKYTVRYFYSPYYKYALKTHTNNRAVSVDL